MNVLLTYLFNIVLILHNEDGVPADRNHTILLHMHIANGQKTLSKFTAYVYAGQLATSGTTETPSSPSLWP